MRRKEISPSQFLLQCAKLAPTDRPAKEKLKECQKELKKRAFAEAISGDHDIVMLSKTMDPSDMGKSRIEPCLERRLDPVGLIGSS